MSAAGKTVLVVEDEPANQRLFRDLLSRTGCTVLITGDGSEAVALAIQEKPALILMDIGLPGVSGLEATRLIRQDAAATEIPIVALTAYAMTEDRDRAIKAGCNAFVAKPFNIAELLAVVSSFLDGAVAGVPEGKSCENGGAHG